MVQSKAKTVAQYLKELPADRRAALVALRPRTTEAGAARRRPRAAAAGAATLRAPRPRA